MCQTFQTLEYLTFCYFFLLMIETYLTRGFITSVPFDGSNFLCAKYEHAPNNNFKLHLIYLPQEQYRQDAQNDVRSEKASVIPKMNAIFNSLFKIRFHSIKIIKIYKDSNSQ